MYFILVYCCTNLHIFKGNISLLSHKGEIIISMSLDSLTLALIIFALEFNINFLVQLFLKEDTYRGHPRSLYSLLSVVRDHGYLGMERETSPHSQEPRSTQGSGIQ